MAAAWKCSVAIKNTVDVTSDVNVDRAMKTLSAAKVLIAAHAAVRIVDEFRVFVSTLAARVSSAVELGDSVDAVGLNRGRGGVPLFVVGVRVALRAKNGAEIKLDTLPNAVRVPKGMLAVATGDGGRIMENVSHLTQELF